MVLFTGTHVTVAILEERENIKSRGAEKRHNRHRRIPAGESARPKRLLSTPSGLGI